MTPFCTAPTPRSPQSRPASWGSRRRRAAARSACCRRQAANPQTWTSLRRSLRPRRASPRSIGETWTAAGQRAVTPSGARPPQLSSRTLPRTRPRPRVLGCHRDQISRQPPFLRDLWDPTHTPVPRLTASLDPRRLAELPRAGVGRGARWDWFGSEELAAGRPWGGGRYRGSGEQCWPREALAARAARPRSPSEPSIPTAALRGSWGAWRCQQPLHPEIYCSLLGERTGLLVASGTSSSSNFMIPFRRGTERQRCAGGRETLPGFSSGECTRPTARRQGPPRAWTAAAASRQSSTHPTGTHPAPAPRHGLRGSPRCRGAPGRLAGPSGSVGNVPEGGKRGMLKAASPCCPGARHEVLSRETRLLRGGKRLQRCQTEGSLMIFKL